MGRETLRGALAPLLVLFSLNAPAAEPPASDALKKFFDRVFMEDLRENPEVATLYGMDLANDKMADRSFAGTERRKARVKARIAELTRFDPKALNTQDRISREVMLDGLQREDRVNAVYGKLPFGGDNLDGWLIASPIQGLQDWYGVLAKAAPTRNVKDYEDFLKRLDAIPLALAQETERMRAGLKSGWMPPRGAMGTTVAQIEAYAKGEPEQSPLFVPFKDYPAAIPEADRKRLTEAAKRAIATRVQPAFAEVQRFVEREYIPATPEALAISARPAGLRGYEIAIENGTTTSMSAREIHELGLREVARIRAEMAKVMAETGFKGTFAEFLVFLREDRQFYYTNAEDMLKGYRDIAKRADAELPRFFAELPRLPYGVRPMELHEGDNADHYARGALDGSRAGFFEANVHFFQKHPKYDMESTLLHEAVPGHHLQIARAQELKGLPEFRRAGGYNAYQEGWALYAESLGYEMGFYKDPYQRFGALSNEALRACRLVIDTGIHAFGWTREQSIKYLLDNSGSSEGFATAEIDRYIVWPGQALGYKVGELKIKALRAKATAELGDKFDIRRFHNALLDDGPLPLTVLEARIDEWIRTEKGEEEMKRHWLAIAALAALPALAQQDFSKIEVKTQKLTDSIYMLTGAGGNLGVCVGEDAVFVVDDQYAPMAPKIQAAIAAISPKPVAFILNTHWHGDHTGGNEVFAKAGAILVAHENVRRRMSSEQFIALFNAKVPASPKAALPVVTFTSDIAFELNGETLRALHVPRAHTDGDAIVQFVKADVVHMGDTFFNGMYPFIDSSSGGTVDGMIAAADKVLAMTNGKTQIIPGHGPLASQADLKAYREMLSTISGRIKQMIKDGRKLEEIKASNATADFEEKFGKGFIKGDKFAEMLAMGLLKQQ